MKLEKWQSEIDELSKLPPDELTILGIEAKYICSTKESDSKFLQNFIQLYVVLVISLICFDIVSLLKFSTYIYTTILIATVLIVALSIWTMKRSKLREKAYWRLKQIEYIKNETI